MSDRLRAVMWVAAVSVVSALGCERRAGARAARADGGPGADGALRAELEGFERRWAAAAVARDRAALDGLMAPEWTITLADGRRSEKARALARWAAPPAPGVVREASTVDSVEVQPLGPDAAVVTAAITDVVVHAAASETTRTRVTDVVVRRAGRWQVLVSHESVRPTPAPARP